MVTGRYRPDTGVPPAIPAPHDCAVTEIREDGGYLVFVFRDHLNDHELLL